MLAYLNYAKIAVAVGLVGLLGFLYLRNRSLTSQRDALRIAVETATAANDAQRAALETLQAQTAKDAARVAKLMREVATISESDRESRRKLDELEKTDADVRVYLDRAVPVALRGLLSNEGRNPYRDGEAPSPGGAVTPVRTP